MKQVLLPFLSVLLVANACTSRQDPVVTEEIARREAFRTTILEAEDAGRARGISARSDIVFEEDFTRINYEPATSFRNHAYRWFGRNAHARLRRHGDHTMHVRIKGWIDRNVLRTTPFITYYVDGKAMSETPLLEDHFWTEFDITPDMFHGEWVDLNIVPSTVAFHWSTVPGLMVAVLYGFDYEERP